MFPAIVGDGADGDVDEWTPLRTLRLLDEVHAGLGRRAVGFARVARDTGADDVLPRGRPSTISRDDVVEVQLAAVETLAAILAHIVVALENVVARELHFLVRKAVEKSGPGVAQLMVKSWMNALLEALLKGGWHPPIVTVEGKIVSQGVVPEQKAVKDAILEARSGLLVSQR